MAARLDDELERLYGLPLDEFTPARNELAKRLKKEGEDDAAAEVRGLAKPPVPVWAVNQLARRDAKGVRALVAAGAALRDAQREALSGAAPDDFRRAQAEQRDAVRELTERARKLLLEAGRPATQAVVERIARTLDAAALDEAAATQLQSGTLREEHEPGGFDALAAFAPSQGAPRQQTGARDELADRRRQKQELERRKRELRERVRDLETRARELERDAQRAESEAAEARRAADEAHAEAQRAAAELAEL